VGFSSAAATVAGEAGHTLNQEQALLTDKPAVRKALLRMLIALEENFHTREDLLQEALVYLWSIEGHHPGQAVYWYLQGAKFHLENLRKSGRSLDSPKHCGAQAALADNRAGRDEWLDTLDFDDGIMSSVNAHDIFSVLEDRLEPTDQLILRAMLEGLCISEIARELHVPRGFVERHRLRIAKRAVQLGITQV